MRLFRVDVDTGKVLEERNRFLGHLYILRGLSGPSR
jgi:hypothetical protein